MTIAVEPAALNGAPAPAAQEPHSLAERSAWGARLARGEFATSIEVMPPRGVDATQLLADVRRIREAGVHAVNIPDGPRAQIRMGTLLTSALIAREVGIEPVVHYTCRDRNLLGMASDMLAASAAGLRNFLVIRGDDPKNGALPQATGVFDLDALGLARMLRDYNRGIDPAGVAIGERTRFVVGVGANPANTDLGWEVERLEQKREAGADFAVTQPVFDPDGMERFLARLPKGHLPIVAGLWPLISHRNAEFLATRVPGVVMPQGVLDRMARANEVSKEHATAEGITIAREVLGRLGRAIQGVQVTAPLGRVEVALEVYG